MPSQTTATAASGETVEERVSIRWDELLPSDHADGEAVIAGVSGAIKGKPPLATVSALSGLIYAAATDASLNQEIRFAMAVIVHELDKNVLQANKISEAEIKQLLLERNGN